MSTFDPDEPCQMHDRLNDRAFEWRTAWAQAYKRDAVPAPDGTVAYDA